MCGLLFLVIIIFLFFLFESPYSIAQVSCDSCHHSLFQVFLGLTLREDGTVIHSKQTIHSLHVCPECCVLPQKLKFSFIFNANKSTDQIAENCVSRRQPRGFPQLMKTSCFTSTIDCSLFFHSFPFFPFLFFLSHNFLKLGLSAVRTYYVYYYLFYRS